MARGPKKHLKRFAAPKSFALDKMSGAWAPRPSTGPHKLRECLPLIILLRNRLKYALTRREVVAIMMNRLIKVDGKVRTDTTYPAGLMDVVSIDKTNEAFRLIYDTKGRFVVHKISGEEAKYKLCKIKKKALGNKGVPYVVTHDARTIRYPDPEIKLNDTIKLDIATNQILDFVSTEVGSLVLITAGHNIGRIGTLVAKEKHQGGHDIVHIQDAVGHEFTTRFENVFTIGKNNESWVSLPRGNGIKLSIADDRAKRLKKGKKNKKF